MIPLALDVMNLVVQKLHRLLGKLARRYTENRSPNFEIYLPNRLAANTMAAFAILIGAGGIVSERMARQELIEWHR